MTDIAKLVEANATRWRNAKLTRPAEFMTVGKRLANAKARYQSVSAKTGVPWFIIAVIHQREASQNWNANIAQGDPWDRVSTHVPAGRGPFPSWDAAADDALINCPPFAARWKDWSPGGAMTLLEQYNGLGYASGPRDIETGNVYPPQPSPYVWSGTDQYTSGKYVRDHVFKPNVVDSQLGCAGLVLAMQVYDHSIQFGTSIQPPAIPVPAPPVVPAPTPVPPPVEAQPSLLSKAIEFILSLFRRG